MIQKVIRIGSSIGITIPKKSAEELEIAAGDTIELDVDTKRKTAVIRPAGKQSARQKKIAKLTLNFIERYREDLKELARK